jgi:hypothetical protein
MKFACRLAFMAIILAPLMARADVTVVKKQSAKLRAFENLEAHLAQLESYSVVYWEKDKKTYVVMKSAPAPQKQKTDQLTVELRSSKKKS